MIEKREDNASPITAQGIHESVSTISLETIDLYLKQLEAQKLQAQSDITASFRQLNSFLNAREKQLLRQVDAMHDHLILILQSRKSFVPDAATCGENKDKNFDVAQQEQKTPNDDKSYNIKATPGIEVSLNTKDLEDCVQVFGKVEMTGSSFMHLSEDNEAFAFPCRVQNYQETSQDHMLLYKPLESAEQLNTSTITKENSGLEYIDTMTPSGQGIMNPINEIAKDVLLRAPLHGCDKEEEDQEMNAVSPEYLEKGNKGTNERNNGRFLRKLSEEGSEDVQHWMREILNETNSEPTSCDPERFDLFTVLKCNLHHEDIKHEQLSMRAEPQRPSNVPAPDLTAEEDLAECMKVDVEQLTQKECLAVGMLTNECDLIE